jgi:6-pyruvoyl tetrahydropterin synthase/QueD family protein
MKASRRSSSPYCRVRVGFEGRFLISVSTTIDYAHRLPSSDSLCRFIHGHRGLIVVGVCGKSVGTDGMVYDFKDVKDIISGVVSPFDHACLVWAKDRPLLSFLSRNHQRYHVFSDPPTAEVMACHIVKGLKRYFKTDKVSVDFEETEGNRALYEE